MSPPEGGLQDVETIALGIDVGANHFTAVGVERYGRVTLLGVDAVQNLDHILDALSPGTWIAIDAPVVASTAPHRGDPDVNRKFQTARCAEIALGQQYGYWVPWTTPSEPPFVEWMIHGFAIHQRATERGFPVAEVYPYAAFRRLGGMNKLPKKGTLAGIHARDHLLRRAGIGERTAVLWSHDALDAAVAAVVARQASQGSAERVTCGHDDSAIWLPTLEGRLK